MYVCVWCVLYSCIHIRTVLHHLAHVQQQSRTALIPRGRWDRQNYSPELHYRLDEHSSFARSRSRSTSRSPSPCRVDSTVRASLQSEGSSAMMPSNETPTHSLVSSFIEMGLDINIQDEMVRPLFTVSKHPGMAVPKSLLPFLTTTSFNRAKQRYIMHVKLGPMQI